MLDKINYDKFCGTPDEVEFIDEDNKSQGD